MTDDDKLLSLLLTTSQVEYVLERVESEIEHTEEGLESLVSSDYTHGKTNDHVADVRRDLKLLYSLRKKLKEAQK